jgi:glycosyltransferase involved in cell wall biosynthesis
MAELAFAIPGDPASRTGGYLYNARLSQELVGLGVRLRPLRWGDGFPHPSAAERAAATADLAALPDGMAVLIDGLAYAMLPDELAHHAGRLRLIALVHHPLALETGLDAASIAGLIASERRALALADAVVVTSNSTAAALISGYDVPAARITVAEPGTEDLVAGLDRVPPGDVVRLLTVASVTPRKGHDVMVAALARIAGLPWRCDLAGSLTRDAECAAALRAQIAAVGLVDRVRLLGELATVGPLYADADIFVLASRYEGYGMAYGEAMRAGLPVVGTRVGAVPDLVPDSAGILVAMDDFAALAEALAGLINDPARRARLAAGAARAGAALPDWAGTARRVLQATAGVPGQPG